MKKQNQKTNLKITIKSSAPTIIRANQKKPNVRENIATTNPKTTSGT